ncbi:type II toxin-antitoxin system RelE/ParE family toxin [Hymenobacter sp. J193]|uniref:type II toxin-antitoxin system RelE/ParE family toxin n=1 Tax=Hymenobacter sp. J193 TaxID=2898429 RepID=UPI0021509490|nr:type II toxin-antitoxin system RelE/ParE family toxin [Hymenobacter sp. J193]MCR5889603.1 type II toxin-antitoxin system RelE/ParE family toxin [Hymenobacter sp. J193]
MVQVRWTNAALEDLAGIRDYTISISRTYAEQLIERLIARTDILGSLPRIGRIVPEYQVANVRELLEGRYRIMYEIIDPDRVDILHVHHMAQPLTAL